MATERERIIGGHHGRELRAPLPDRATLVATAIQTGNFKKLPAILARQSGIFYGQDHAGIYGSTSFWSRLDAIKMLLGREPIPLEVLMTCEAIMRHQVSPDVDPSLAHKIIGYRPPSAELSAWGFTEDDVRLAKTRVPIRAGTVVWVHYDGVDDNIIWMRRVPSGPYKDRYTTGGGWADSRRELTALEEGIEEGGIHSFRAAKPLGMADQIIAVEDDKGLRLERVANYLWVCPLEFGEAPHNVEPGRRWEDILDDQVSALLAEGAFTPIAECALRLIGPPFCENMR